MTKVRLYPAKPDGSPNINALGQLIELEDLPRGATEFDGIASWENAGPDGELVMVPTYVAPR